MAEASAVIGILSFGIQVCQGITKYYGAWRDCPEEVSSTSNTIDSLRTIFVQFKDILADTQLEQDTRTLVEERVSACLAGLRKLEAENKQFGSSKPSKFQMAIHRLSYPFKQDTLDRLKKVVGGLLGQLSIALQVLDIRAGSRHHEEFSAAIADTQRAIEKVCTEVYVVRDLVDSVRGQHQTVLDLANANHADTITHLERLRLDAQQTSKHVRQLLSDAEAAKLERILTWIRAPDVTSNHNAACLRRHPGTGQWFLDSADYLSWKYGGTARLWLHGKIGCCKTVLASTIIEDMRSHCRAYPNCSLAYFYITFSDDKKQSWEDILRALVMQLSQGHSPVQVLVDAFDREYGHGLTVRDLERALVEILTVACCEGRSVFVVVDGLDESPDTLDHRVAVYEGLSRLSESCDGVHFLVTSRRYADVERFMGGWGALFVKVSVAFVNEDIKSFVQCQLATNPGFSSVDDCSRFLITEKLSGNPGGMFRWAALHLEALRRLPVKTRKRIEKALSILPPTLSATYEQMLSDIPDDCAVQVAHCLLWLAASPRPLALYELAEAMRVDPNKPDVTVLDLDALDVSDMVEIMSGMVVTRHIRRVCKRCRSTITGKYFICRVCSDSFYNICEPCRDSGEVCKDTSHVLVPHDTLRVELAHASVEEFLLGCGAKAERARRFLIDKAKRTSIVSTVIDRPDVYGRTALHLAMKEDSIEKLQLLLAQGANANVAILGSGATPLHVAVGFGDARYVKALLASGADVNALDDEEDTALTAAIMLGCIKQIAPEYTSPSFARSRAFRNNGAVRADYDECARLLLQNGADPNLGLPFVWAAGCGRAAMVRLLLDNGADANSQISSWATDKLQTAVIERSCDDEAMNFLAHGVKTANIIWYGWTALHLLCSGGWVRAIEELCDLKDITSQLLLEERYAAVLDVLLTQEGADINMPDSVGCTLLMAACEDKHSSFIERLLDQGSDLDARDDRGWTALFHAVRKGRLLIVELLITRGARVNIVAWLRCEDFEYRRGSLRGAASAWEEYCILDILVANGAKLRHDMDEVECGCDIPRPPSDALRRRRSWPQHLDLPSPGIIGNLLPLKIIGDLEGEESRCNVPCPPPKAPKRQRSWPHYPDSPPVEVIDDTDEEESEWDVPHFPWRAPRRRRSWPQFWDTGPLETRPSASVAPYRPWRVDEEIRWDNYDIPYNNHRIWWDGVRYSARMRSLSLVEECI
ncbi:hypothetical protein LTR97_012175 [Elasticomyces elasticus]|uniref:Nephrocystin 3-like N-terminal domain-containing protein n=1 Tax=Elasticomyces elasticus TaxID=574655 RepID=A0AAN7VZC1_9PEZI|nr:hypothetical protein LTR97_012175 [Elasticomyces elasticus]